LPSPVMVDDDFYVALEFSGAGLFIGNDLQWPFQGRSYQRNSASEPWRAYPEGDFGIRAVVRQVGAPTVPETLISPLLITSIALATYAFDQKTHKIKMGTPFKKPSISLSSCQQP